MNTTAQPRLDWMNVGREFSANREAEFLAAIERIDRGDQARAQFDEWLKVPSTEAGEPPLRIGFGQGEAIKSAIKEFSLPRVSHIAVSDCIGHGFYGVRAHYGPKQKQYPVELFVLDLGHELIPILARVWPKPE